MFLAFVDGITFKNGCKITNSKDGKLIATQYEVNNLTGDYTGSSTVDPTQRNRRRYIYFGSKYLQFVKWFNRNNMEFQEWLFHHFQQRLCHS